MRFLQGWAGKNAGLAAAAEWLEVKMGRAMADKERPFGWRTAQV
jgi:hypothetical protein